MKTSFMPNRGVPPTPNPRTPEPHTGGEEKLNSVQQDLKDLNAKLDHLNQSHERLMASQDKILEALSRTQTNSA